MRKSLAACALALASLLPTAQALAWNHKGHMTVALIAYRQLSPQERERASRLLRNHPDYRMLKGLADKLGGDPGQALFVTAARWPDLIRSDPRFFDETKGEKPTKRLKGFPDMKKHRPWHFKDEGFSPDGTPVRESPPDNNAEDSIRDFREIIGDPGRSLAHRAYYLAWLEHLVGDVHQPLHCVARFTRDRPNGDAGGNLFAIAPFRIPELNFDVDNLHSFWDDSLGDDTRLADIRALADRAEASTPEHSDADLNEANWVDESFAAAKSAAYAPLGGTDPARPAAPGRRASRQPPPPAVTPAYFADAQALGLRRLKLAGRRLAAVIREDLK